jgi:DNA-directed RNA polymerase specialized sigma subunit
MARSREISWNPQPDPDDEWYDYTFANRTSRGCVAHSETRPDTEMQALMEAPPGQDPETSLEQALPLREILGAAFDLILDERERWVADALWVRRLSFRQLGRELNLSSTHILRLRDEIRDKLIAELLTHNEIQEYLSEQ